VSRLLGPDYVTVANTYSVQVLISECLDLYELHVLKQGRRVNVNVKVTGA